MKIKSTLILSLVIALCAACSNTNLANKPAMDEDLAAKSEGPQKPDMKAMFGPDYKKGDIGHSKGVVTRVDASAELITIDHGVVHGTSILADLSVFETLPSAKNVVLAPDDQVEFLLKKGSDNAYRLLKICAFTDPETGCL